MCLRSASKNEYHGLRQIMEKIAEVTQFVFQETQIVDTPVPQIMEENLERVQITLQERVQNRTVRSWACPLPRFSRRLRRSS